MAIELKMPKLGVIEGDIQLVEWKKKEGDIVEKGEAVAAVEGEKVTNDVNAPESGTILKLCVEVGEGYPIGTILAIIGEVGEDISTLALSETAKIKQESNATKPGSETAETFVEPVASSQTGGEGQFIKASPAAKKLARANNVELVDVATALGITKRIQGADVQCYIDEFVEGGVPGNTGSYTEVKLVGMRKTIADNMSLSTRETAPVVLMRSVDITELYAFRKEMKKVYEAKGKKAPSFNDLMIKAVALALEDHPRLNATFQNNAVRTYKDININMAVAVDAGLVTPVIPRANRLTIDEISQQARDLAEKATAGTLTAGDYHGGTFTVTNLGMLDIEVSTPILNQPQVAILAIGTVQPFLKMQDGKVVERFKTFFSLTLDHRVVDGYPGAQYLYTLAEILTKTPAKLWS